MKLATSNFEAVANEFVLPLLPAGAQPSSTPELIQTDEVIPSDVRAKQPSSDWVYYKIYTGLAAAEKILFGEIREHFAQWHDQGLIDKWFFIRYKDPATHIRLRLHGIDAPKLWKIVVPALNDVLSKLVNDKRIARFSIDTYVREMERYGGLLGMPHAETLFCADSFCAAQLFSGNKLTAQLDVRWKVGMSFPLFFVCQGRGIKPPIWAHAES